MPYLIHDGEVEHLAQQGDQAHGVVGDRAQLAIGDIQSIEDFIVSNNLLPLGSLLYVIFCVTRGGWGWDNFLKAADTGEGVKFPRWSRYWLMFGVPILIVIIFVMGYVPKIVLWLGLA